MKASERDELLIRTSERVNNIWNILDRDIRPHLEKINGTNTDHSKRINKNRIIAIVALILASGGASAPLWVSKLIGG